MCREDQIKRPHAFFLFLTSKNASLGQAAIQADGSTMAIFAVTMAKASIGQGGAGGCDATVLEQVEAGRRGRG